MGRLIFSCAGSQLRRNWPVIFPAEKLGFSGHVMPGKGEVHNSKVIRCGIECDEPTLDDMEEP
jgi:hypothetical protein